MKWRSCCLFIVLLGFGCNVRAQLTDLARIEYSFIPKSKSEDQYTRLRLLLNYPIKVKEDSYFIIGTQYNRIILNLRDYPNLDESFIETLTILDVSFAYTYKMNEKWRAAFKVTPRLASTLNEKISSDDLFINGGVFFIKDRTKAEDITPYRLILGLTYNTTAGIPFPLPLISYYREFAEQWSYTVGVPKMNLKYRFDDKKNMQAFIGLDGYFAHLQRPTQIANEDVNSISLSIVATGLGYEYQFTDHLVAFAYTGYTLRLNNILRDDDRNEVLQLDNLNSFYLRTGLKFKI